MKLSYIINNIWNKQLLSLGFLLLVCLFQACKKQDDWLDKKRSISNVEPSNLRDLQAVLDNTNIMNLGYAQIGLLGADNNIITDANLTAAPQTERNSYLWAKDIFVGASAVEWSNAYQMVEYANIVLDALGKITPNNNTQRSYDSIKGSALFYRSFAFYVMSQLFCKPYSASTASTDLGIPIRLSSDVNIPSVRSTVKETYNQILNDLQMAVGLLPQTPLYTTRPSSVAALALLSKVYLSMEDYQQAGHYADLTLQKKTTLLDFKSNIITPTSTFRFPVFNIGNPEIIFYASTASRGTLAPRAAGVGTTDANLYASYLNNDLRKTIFYQDYGGGRVKFQGTYTGIDLNFAGIATNEIYLIRAECYARAGNTTLAMADLNTLLKQRFTNPYTDLIATDADDALVKILQERRKELPYTGQLRWEDLRRLNKDPRFAKTLQRTYNGVTYSLPPNDNRYVFPIPDLEIQMYGMPQNER